MSTAATDLAQRWRSARRAALRAVLPDSRDDDSEEDLLAKALDADPKQVLRRAFDNGLALGEGFRRFHRLDLPLTDLVRLLPQLGTPCLGAEWTHVAEPLHYRAERAGCRSGALHASACDFYREAIQGLVLGLTGSVHHTRYESVGHGAERCVDALYVHPQSTARFGPIPESIRVGLSGVERSARMFDSSVQVEFLGLSESTLYYTVSSAREGTNLSMTNVIERLVLRRYPEMRLQDAAPRAVLNDST